MPGYDAEQMQQAMQADQETARLRTRGRRIGKTGRLRMAVDTRAVMNAVNTEGREVMSPAGKEYWDDMRRRYPWTDFTREVAAAPGALRNRFGRARERVIYGADGSRRRICEHAA